MQLLRVTACVGGGVCGDTFIHVPLSSPKRPTDSSSSALVDSCPLSVAGVLGQIDICPCLPRKIHTTRSM